MDAMVFLFCYNKMRDICSSCSCCEAQEIDCELSTDEPEKLVAAVERWAKAHPKEAANATKPKQDEPCAKTMQDDLSGAIYQKLKDYENRFAEIKV